MGGEIKDQGVRTGEGKYVRPSLCSPPRPGKDSLVQLAQLGGCGEEQGGRGHGALTMTVPVQGTHLASLPSLAAVSTDRAESRSSIWTGWEEGEGGKGNVKRDTGCPTGGRVGRVGT